MPEPTVALMPTSVRCQRDVTRDKWQMGGAGGLFDRAGLDKSWGGLSGVAFPGTSYCTNSRAPRSLVSR